MAESFQIGHGLIQTNDFGPLISGDQRKRVMKYIKQGLSEGATLVCGGNEVNDKGYFIEPTIFTDVTGEMSIAKEEIFGPVLCIEKFSIESLEEIPKRANKTTYGLSGSVWTNDISTGHKMAALIDSGQVSINCHAAVDSAILWRQQTIRLGKRIWRGRIGFLSQNKGHYSYVLIYQGTWLPNRSKNLPLSFALIDQT